MEWDEPVSPELVLVDPALAMRLRERARREDARTVPHAGPAPVAGAAGLPSPIAHPAPDDRKRRLANAVVKAGFSAALTLIALLALLPFLAFLPPRDAPTVVDSSAQALPPPHGWLAWPPHEGADSYVVQILDAGHPIHATVATKPNAPVPGTLRPGVYTWRVFVDDNERRGPIAQGSFDVPAG